MSDSRRLRWVTVGSTLLALVGIGYAVLTLSRIPANASGDGFVEGLIAAFGLALLLTSVLALLEASLLAFVTWRVTLPTLPRRLFVGGAVAGGLSVLPTLTIEITRILGPGSPLASSLVRLAVPVYGAWLLLAALGLFCSGAGTILYGAKTVRQRLNKA